MPVQGSSRRILLIILGVLTIILLVVAVLIGVRLQQSQAPTEASAGCSHYNGTDSMTICGGASAVTVTIQTCNCPNATGGAYPACICNENCSSQSVTIPANESRTYTASASCGTQQIDVGGSDLFGSGVCAGASHACGGSSSSSSSSGGGSKACGEACSNVSECRGAANGGTVVCRNGLCENRDCPTGHTIFGANCDCDVAARTCGQTCGASVGLCGDGLSVCRFRTGAACTGNEFNNSTVCVPVGIKLTSSTVPGWLITHCGGCTSGCNSYVTKDGANPSMTEIQEACQIASAQCGNGVIETIAGEVCDPTANPPGCAAGMNCGSDCQCTTNPVCGGTCTDNTQCPNNHTCTSGACVLNGCTPTTCTNGCIPLCGGPCVPALGSGQCPTGHTCSTTTNTCILNACSTDPATCTNNGCTSTILPNTALISDNVDRILIGGLLLVLGVLAVKFKWIESAEDFMIYLNGRGWDAKSESRLVRKSRKKYEDEFDK